MKNRPYPFMTHGLAAFAGILLIHSTIQAASNTWTGTVDSNWNTTTPDWTSPTIWNNGDDAVFGSGVATVTVAADVTANSLSLPGAATSLNIATGQTLRISRTTAAPPPWAKITGAGTLSLATAATFDYGWGLVGLPAGFTGTLKLEKGRASGNPANLGGATNVVICNGAQFLAYDGTANTYTYPQNFSLSGLTYGEAGQESGALRVSQINATFTGNLTLTGNSGIYTQSTTGAVMTVSGPISDGGSGYALAINAYGNPITLNGTSSNTHTGTTTIDGGTVYLGKTGGAAAISGPLTMGAGNTNQPNLRMAADKQFADGVVMSFANPSPAYTRFSLLGTAQTLAGLQNITGAGVTQNGGLGVGAATNATLTINNSTDYSYNGYLRNYDSVNSGGVLNLVKTGTGTQTLSGGNVSYSGATTVNNGTLALQNTTSLGSAITVNTNGTLKLINTATGFAARATLTRNISGTGTISVNNSGTGVAGAWVKLNSGGGNLVGFSGTVNVNSGVLTMDNLSGTITGNPALNVVAGGVFGIRGQNVSIDVLTGDGDVANDWNDDRSGHTLTVGANGGSATFTGVIHGNNTGATDGTLESGLLHLAKSGGGTLTLTNSHTYTGMTTVNGGTLVVNGSLATGAVAVNTSATLSGTGTLNGPVNVAAGGTVSPGTSGTGTLTFNGNLSLAGTAGFTIHKAAAALTSNKADGFAGVTYGGNLTVTATGDTLAIGDSFELFVPHGTFSGAFASFTLPSLPAGLSWDTSTLLTDGRITVVNYVGTPNFNPAAGGYVGAQVVTITSDSGSTIHYTTDGSDPTTSITTNTAASPLAGVAVPVDSTMTIRAYASKSGQANSPVADASYTTVTTAVWNVDGDGLWSESAKWFAGVVPNGSGAPVDFSAVAQSLPATVTLDSNRTVGGMTFGNTYNHNWTLASSGGSVLTFDGGSPTITVLDNTTTISAMIAGSQGLTTTGPGTLVLSGANSYAGNTTINGCTLSAGSLAPNGNNSGIGAGTDLTLNGGTLRYTGGNVGNDTLSTEFNRNITLGTGGGTIDIAGPGLVFCNGSFAGSNTLSVVDTNGDLNNKQLLLTSDNPSFSGDIHIGNGTPNSGWLQVRSAAARPLGSGIITINTGGILSSDHGVTTPTMLANNIVLNGGTLMAQFAPTNFTGSVTVNAGSTSTLTTLNNQNLVISGNIAGTGTLEKSAGTFSIQLHGDNGGFTGTYNHRDGGATIFYTSTAGSAAASWNIPPGSNAAARFMAADTNATYQLGSLAGAAGYLENLTSAAGDSTFEIGALNTDSEFDGVIRDNGGTVGITKVGGGTLTLGGINAYSGNTVVNGGTLHLADNAQLKFVIGAASGTNNRISGWARVIIDGDFLIDAANAASLTSGTWTLENVTGPTRPYGPTFTVIGFTDAGADKWTKVDGDKTWTFDEITGVLTVKRGDFETWMALYPSITNPAEQLPAADPDGDGQTNRNEYAFGLDPSNGAWVSPITAPLNQTTGMFSYTRRNPTLTGLIYKVWTSTDMRSWTEDPGAVQTPTAAGDNQSVAVTLSGMHLTAGALFVQVTAE